MGSPVGPEWPERTGLRVGASFLVTEEDYNRATEFEVHPLEPFQSSAEPTDEALGFEVVNFNDQSVEIDIEVLFHEEDCENHSRR